MNPIDTNLAETKNIFYQMWQFSPAMTILFWLFALATLALITINTITKHNPGWFNKIIDKKGTNEPPEKERRHNKRRKEDVQINETITEQISAMRKDFKEQIKTVNTNIDKLFTVTNALSGKLEKVSQGTLESLLFNESASIDSRIKAFRRLTAMGINSEVKTIGFKLILNNKTIWKVIKKEPIDVEILDQEYYKNTIKELENKIFDGGIKID